jgi:hypothetical protein
MFDLSDAVSHNSKIAKHHRGEHVTAVYLTTRGLHARTNGVCHAQKNSVFLVNQPLFLMQSQGDDVFSYLCDTALSDNSSFGNSSFTSWA